MRNVIGTILGFLTMVLLAVACVIFGGLLGSAIGLGGAGTILLIIGLMIFDIVTCTHWIFGLFKK